MPPVAPIGSLHGIRVVEHCGWSGAFAGRLLADAGADVVRVLSGPDPFAVEAPFLANGKSIPGLWYQLGKRVVQVDPAKETAEFERLLAGADILIEDWIPGSAPIDSGHLQQLNPGLVRISVTPFGRHGPWSEYRTTDLVANALSGAASVTGTKDTPPINGFGNQTYSTTGMYAAICALAGLRGTKATGRGVRIDLSAHEALATCTEQVLMEWFFPSGPAWKTAIAPRQGALHWSNAYDVFPAKDGRGVMVSAALNFAGSLLPWLEESGGAQELTNKERYPDIVSMVRDLPNLMRILREWVGTWDSEEFFYEAQRRHQPFGPVMDIASAATTPQVEARNVFQPVALADGTSVRMPGRFLRTSADGNHPVAAQEVDARTVDWVPRPLRTYTPGDPTRPLEGMRILDFTHVLAGPFGTRVLADLGAEVIKVSTAARSVGANSNNHPYFCMWNRNKKSITLDMTSEVGRATARRLAANCDAIIDNFSAGVLARWGLDKVGMAAENPGLTVVSMGGMGRTGPWSSFVTFAPTIHALCGLTYMTNPPGEHGFGYGFSLTDHLSGLVGALAILQGVQNRELTGEGLDVDLSQYELGLGLMAPALIDFLANGTNPEPTGNRHSYDAAAPHGIYPATGDDRWVAIAVSTEREWRALCRAMWQPGLVADSRFASHSARVAHREELDVIIGEWTSPRDAYETMRLLQAAGVPAGVVQNAEDLAMRDPQLADRGFFGRIIAGRFGETGVDRFPALFDGVRPSTYVGAPDAGGDTFDVLATIGGYTEDEIAALAAAGALT